jgi:acyl-CoA dehydrogenase
MEFTPSRRAIDFAARIDAFVRAEVFPLERSANEDGLPAEVLAAARQKAKDAGLWAPQLPVELGGQGLDFLDVCFAFEAAGQSLVGPLVLGCAAPDEGNAHLLLRAATAAQRKKYLEPLARGELRSTFAMTEPAPGAGSDPRMMRSRAVRDGGEWVIDGHKWFASGADGAAFAIVAARTDPEPGAGPKDNATLFLVDAGTPGYEVVRRVPALGGGTPGGHCEVLLTRCRVGSEQVLGGVGNGFRLMQERLGPARLTHCMRWLGAAKRALEVACARAREREAFGAKLAEHQAVQWMLADSATEIHAARWITYEAAWRMERGEKARRETSMCKVFVAETVNRAIDRALQVCGSLGISEDLPLARMYAEARAFRIYDGPSEVHRMLIARELLRGEG